MDARGGGIFIALGLIAGTVAGVVVGEPTAGLVGGLALGILAALAMWWRDRRG